MIKVLIVDDNKDNRLTLRLFLEDYEELSIFEADNGKKAIETVKLANPDIIFMDIMMPVVDGIEATREIRKLDKSVMIIALSVLSDNENKTEILKAGAEDYITKPINEELFKARMNNYILILEHRRSRERNRGAVNLFSKDIYLKKTAFMINDEAGLAEFWEHEMPPSQNDNLCDAIRAVYHLGLHLLKANSSFQIVSEENDDTIFFSIVGLKNFITQDVRDIFTKESSFVSLAIKRA
jgi:two-component system chemotaxis response regulator CheY